MSATTKGLDEIRVFRSQSVIEQYGEGFSGEQPRDEVEREVLRAGKPYYMIMEKTGKRFFRAVTPFVISENRGGLINCLDCHEGKVGDANGAVNIVISLEEKDEELQKNIVEMSLFLLAQLGVIFGLVILVTNRTVNRVLRAIVNELKGNSSKLERASAHLADISQATAESPRANRRRPWRRHPPRSLHCRKRPVTTPKTQPPPTALWAKSTGMSPRGENAWTKPSAP